MTWTVLLSVAAGSFLGTLVARVVSEAARGGVRMLLVPREGRFRVETRAKLEHYIVDQAGTVFQGPIEEERFAGELRDLFEMAYGERGERWQ